MKYMEFQCRALPRVDVPWRHFPCAPTVHPIRQRPKRRQPRFKHTQGYLEHHWQHLHIHFCLNGALDRLHALGCRRQPTPRILRTCGFSNAFMHGKRSSNTPLSPKLDVHHRPCSMGNLKEKGT